MSAWKKFSWILILAAIAVLAALPFQKQKQSSGVAGGDAAGLVWRGEPVLLDIDAQQTAAGNPTSLADQAIEDDQTPIQFNASSNAGQSASKVQPPVLQQLVPPPSISQVFAPETFPAERMERAPLVARRPIEEPVSAVPGLVDQHSFLTAPQRRDRTAAPSASGVASADARSLPRAEGNSATPIPPATSPVPKATASAAPLVKHKIADGDSLPSLAQKYLGDRDRYLEIYELNRDRLSSPNVLPIGVEIEIPR